MSDGSEIRNGPIAYMAKNHVASNILMFILLVGGALIGSTIKQEVFPEFEMDLVTVSVAYPGATPSEVEEAIVRPVELAVSAVVNIKKTVGVATESVGMVTLEVLEGEDVDIVLQDVKSEVDRILTFPEEAEKPVITKVTNRQEVISLLVYGDVSERSLREHAELVRDDLLVMSEITMAEIAAARPYEISIEISEENLRKYNLTLDRVAAMVRTASLDLAGGTIKSSGGEVLIRTTEKRYTGVEFDSVSVFTFPDGRRVFLGDIAEVRDAFAEVDQAVLFDGKPAVMVNIYRVGDQRPKDIARIVHQYVRTRNEGLPPSVRLSVYRDWAELLRQRMDLLFKNGALGLVLVMITLSLFLEIRLAFWVALGIAISFLGAMLFMPGLGVSINMISLFAFLTILGIVVDDAIVVGENIYVHFKRGKPLHLAAVDGTREVTLAVVFAALTTMAAFGALLFLGGFMGNFMGAIPKIVITVLVISLVEVFFILPSHLSGGLVRNHAPIWARIESKRAWFDRRVRHFVEHTYSRILEWAARRRYVTISIAIAILMIASGLLRSGLIKFVFFPEVESDEVRVSLQMPPGTPFTETRDHALRIQKIGDGLLEEIDAGRKDGGNNLKHRFTLLGQQISGGGPMGAVNTFASNLAEVRFLLDDPGKRTVSTSDFASDWREAVGGVPGAERLSFMADMIHGGGDVELELSHSDYDVLLIAVERLKEALTSYEGVREISDSHSEGKREMKLRLRPEASSLGITERDLAVQIRSAFYGAEAMRIQRGQNEVKVMVRYPEEDRRALETIEKMRIRTPLGLEVPFDRAAQIDEGRGFSMINRTDRRRVITVSARVNKELANATDILSDLQSGVLGELAADYPGLTYNLEGRSRDQQESVASLKLILIFGLFLIYCILAIPFRSFLQPFIVMSVIPFGLIGALIGHLLFGYNLSMISLFGMVALTGVVVNDSLVMIDFINRERRGGATLIDAVMMSGKRRFRPILMTSLTTFFGLAPMIFETSLQAKFLVPLALSLGFGVLFATGITLILIPILFLILEDVTGFLGWRGVPD